MADWAVTIAATCSSIVAVTFGYPFDSVKTRMQAISYPSTTACIKQTFKTEGTVGFFRGVVPVLVTVSAFRSLAFNIYGSCKRRLSPEGDSLRNLAYVSFVSGTVTGACVAALNIPIEYVKVQRQLAATSPNGICKPSDSSLKWATQIVKSRGFFKLYTGGLLHTARDGLGTGMYFCTYEISKRLMNPDSGFTHLVSGGLAGTLCWIVLFPIDVVKSVIQKESLSLNPKYSSSMDFVRQSLQTVGIRRFYNGLGAQLIRSFPVHALNFYCFEKIYSLLK